MALRKYFSFWLVLATYHTQVSGYNRSAVIVNQTIHVLQSSSILLECDDLSANDKSKWKHGEDIIFIDKNALSTDLKSTVVLSQNYSLLISPTLLLHEGWYQCIRNSMTVRRYQVIVEAPPIVYITINGTNFTKFAVLEQEERFIARCYAERSKPKVNLTWKINNKAIKPSEYSNECRITEQTIFDNVYNCVSKLETNIQDKNGTITCTASAKSTFGERSISVTFRTYRSKISPTAYLLPVAFVILIPLIIVATRFYLVSKQKGQSRGNQPSSIEKRRSEQGDVDDTVELQIPGADKKSTSFRDVCKNLQDMYSTPRRISSREDLQNIVNCRKLKDVLLCRN